MRQPFSFLFYPLKSSSSATVIIQTRISNFSFAYKTIPPTYLRFSQLLPLLSALLNRKRCEETKRKLGVAGRGRKGSTSVPGFGVPASTSTCFSLEPLDFIQ